MNPNDYENQKTRALSRKKELVNLMGGKCSVCGYGKNLSALEFHHINPNEKSFQLDSRHLSNTSIDKILKEAKKCILVCSNCHKEIHHPELEEKNADNVLKRIEEKHSSVFDERGVSICPVCGKNFKKIPGKIYCSNDCRYKNKNYPSKEEVEKVYKELKSQNKTAEYFGLSRKVIINILKR